MHQEDELDFDEDELVPQPFVASASTTSSNLPTSSSSQAALSTQTTKVQQSAAAAPAKPAHDPSLDATGKKLPEGWVSRISNTTGELYYRDTVSNTSSWEIPTIPAGVQKQEPQDITPSETLVSNPVPAAQPQPSAQVTKQTVEEAKLEKREEKPLPTGPRNPMRAPPTGPASATPTLPTGPRWASNPASANFIARHAQRPVLETSSSRAIPSNDSSKPPTPTISTIEPPKGPRASLEKQRRQSIPTSSNSPFSQSVGPRFAPTSSSSTPITAPSGPAPARASNAVPLGPRKPRDVPSNSSPSASPATAPISTSTSSRSIDADNSRYAPPAESRSRSRLNGDSERAPPRRTSPDEETSYKRSSDRDLPPHVRESSLPPPTSSSRKPPIAPLNAYRGPRRLPGHNSRVRKHLLQPTTTGDDREEEEDVTMSLVDERGESPEEGGDSRSRSQDERMSDPPPPASRNGREWEREDRSGSSRRDEFEQREEAYKKRRIGEDDEREYSERSRNGRSESVKGPDSSRRERERSPVDYKRSVVREDEPEERTKRRERSTDRERDRDRDSRRERERDEERREKERSKPRHDDSTRRNDDRYDERPANGGGASRSRSTVEDDRRPSRASNGDYERSQSRVSNGNHDRIDVDLPLPPRRRETSDVRDEKRSNRDERERERTKDAQDIRDRRDERTQDRYRGSRNDEADVQRSRDHRDDHRDRRPREPSPPLLRFASSSTPFLPPPPLPSTSDRHRRRNRSRSRSRSPPPRLPPTDLKLRIGSGPLENRLNSTLNKEREAAVPLIRIVGGSAEAFGLNGNERKRRDEGLIGRTEERRRDRMTPPHLRPRLEPKESLPVNPSLPPRPSRNGSPPPRDVDPQAPPRRLPDRPLGEKRGGGGTGRRN
ncbi:uncharacterized protein JCM6883_002472 [Sporobolomyces salmoneus]|uniref:uncharacterized protein n=1 Tax=Sporobolomyces salmoneus TaxID=183962 RepID=UPI003171841C